MLHPPSIEEVLDAMENEPDSPTFPQPESANVADLFHQGALPHSVCLHLLAQLMRMLAVVGTMNGISPNAMLQKLEERGVPLPSDN